MERDGIRNGAGHTKWYESNIKQILTNEKYIGDALLQKTYTKSVLDKVRCKNDGQMPKYYVEGSHPPIIDKEIFLRVQAEVASRANIAGNGKRRIYSSKYAFSGVVRCAHCGDVFRRIKWNNRGNRSTVWRCVSRVEKDGPDCCARTIREEDLHGAVVTAVNDICLDQASVTRTLMENTRAVIESNADSRILEIDKMIKEKQKELLEAGQDDEKVDAIGDEILRLRDERQSVLSAVAIRKGTQERLEELSGFLRTQTTAITEYSDSLVRRLISTITVYDEKVVVVFKSGLQAEVEI